MCALRTPSGRGWNKNPLYAEFLFDTLGVRGEDRTLDGQFMILVLYH